LLWGGPLVVPNDLMGGTRRLIHAVYMFTQNFSFGIYRGLASPAALSPESFQPAGASSQAN